MFIITLKSNIFSSYESRCLYREHCDVYTAPLYLWHLLGNNVDHVRRRDVLLALRARIMFPPSSAVLFFPLLLLLFLLLYSLLLPTLLLQFDILVRHRQTCGRGDYM